MLYNSKIKPNRSYHSSQMNIHKVPLFFKLWFGFITIGIIFVFSLVGYTFYQSYQMASHPEKIGSYIGEVINGVKDTVR